MADWEHSNARGSFPKTIEGRAAYLRSIGCPEAIVRSQKARWEKREAEEKAARLKAVRDRMDASLTRRLRGLRPAGRFH